MDTRSCLLPPDPLRQTEGEVKREMLIWNVVTEEREGEKAESHRDRVTYFLVSDLNEMFWGPKLQLKPSDLTTLKSRNGDVCNTESDLCLNQIPNPDLRIRKVNKTTVYASRVTQKPPVNYQ